MNQKEIFIERSHELKAEIKRLEEALTGMPEGNIVCYQYPKNGNTYNMYYKQIRTEGKVKRTYLSKKDSPEARTLAMKMYLSRDLADKKNELKCLDYYLKNRIDADTSSLFAFSSPYRSLLVNKDSPVENWEYELYNKSTDHPEHLIIPAPKGDYMRSKSEAMIAQVLFSHGIPYRYEEIHQILDASIATDFTVMHPLTHKIKLWEHFGLSENPEYQRTIDFKMSRYIRAGYLPGHNLIITFEDKQRPLSYVQVEELVKMYFL